MQEGEYKDIPPRSFSDYLDSENGENLLVGMQHLIRDYDEMRSLSYVKLCNQIKTMMGFKGENCLCINKDTQQKGGVNN